MVDEPTKEEVKQSFFNLVSEYEYLATDTHIRYAFGRKDIEKVKWFLEMLWSISETFDVRVVIEDDVDKMFIYLRASETHWRLFD
jgi:hypothetical protein